MDSGRQRDLLDLHHWVCAATEENNVSPFNALWVSLMTAIVFGTAMGQSMRNWWQGTRMGAAALGFVLLGPTILIAFSHSKSLEVFNLFVPAVFTANGIFWAWMLWPRRRRPTA